MKKRIALSAITVGLLSSVSLQAAGDLSSMFSEGKTSGQIRAFYIDREYQGGSGKDTHRNSMALGGHLKFETADYKGLSVAAALYTTNDIAGAIGYGNGVEQDPSLLGTGKESYSILGEAYVNYDMSSLGTKTTAKLGYQRYDTPMMGSDDARMLPNTFEAYKFTNKDIDGINFQLAQVNSIAYGTFSNIYGGGILGATSGYPAGGNAGTGKYHNLGQATVGENTNGVTNFLVSFKNKNFNAKLSNDYAWDLYNTIYAEAGAKWNCLLTDAVKPFFSVQAIKQNSVGDELMKNVAIDNQTTSNPVTKVNGSGEIDSLYYAAKLGAKYAGLTAYVAYSETSANNASDVLSGNAYKNAIVSQFGGMPAYTQGMVTRHQFLAGTKTTKVAASYNFKDMGANVSATAYYASFDMDENSGYGVARTATEPGFDIKYYPQAVKNLQLRLRGNFPRNFAETTASNDTGWNEYRFIANYNF
ncbi:MAG: OprD family outer membrane porin [Sulfurimonas sp.]|nr:OprD family outer membrane porin [Sulfurimonas sp.]